MERDQPSFGTRLASAIMAKNPLCVGIDPSAALLRAWGLSDSAGGVESMGRTVVASLGQTVAAIKPQIAYFERHGAKGYQALERILQDARDQGILVIADVKRGDIDATMAAYGDAWLSESSPLSVDAMTVTAYLGIGAMTQIFDQALQTKRGVFVVVASSNPEGRSLQTAITSDGTLVDASLLEELARRNDQELSDEKTSLGSFGAVVGATRSAGALKLASLRGPYLVPGIGAQGATPRDVGILFGDCAKGSVLVNASRSILEVGPSGERLAQAADSLGRELKAVLET